jgi:fructose-1,6-bisphosphatase I
MYKAVPTLTDFVLDEARQLNHASGSFITLVTQIENVVKIIASHVRASGLVDILGKTGAKNSFGEEVQKLDEFSNKLFIDSLISSGEVYALISEEEDEPIFAPKTHAGEYIVYFDPLDGSSNIDTNCPIGTIFSIYRKNKDLLQKGSEQVAAGYVIYGSSVMFVYSAGKGVNGFTLDPSIGSFLLSHPKIQMPKKGVIYSINEAYEAFYDDHLKRYLSHLKETGSYKARYVGSLIADAHRTFLKGGIFLYPADKKQPEGKLRLMLEVNPFAFLVEQAGGKVVSHNKTSPLTVQPKHIHQRAPLIMGSEEEVEKYLEYEG